MDGKCKSCLYNVGEYNSKSRPRSNQLLYDLFIYIIQTRWLHDNYHSLKYCNSGTSQSSNFKPRNVQSSNLQGNVSYHYSAVTTLLWSRLSYLMHDNNMVCIFCTSLSPCCKPKIILYNFRVLMAALNIEDTRMTLRQPLRQRIPHPNLSMNSKMVMGTYKNHPLKARKEDGGKNYQTSKICFVQ